MSTMLVYGRGKLIMVMFALANLSEKLDSLQYINIRKSNQF